MLVFWLCHQVIVLSEKVNNRFWRFWQVEKKGEKVFSALSGFTNFPSPLFVSLFLWAIFSGLCYILEFTISS